MAGDAPLELADRRARQLDRLAVGLDHHVDVYLAERDVARRLRHLAGGEGVILDHGGGLAEHHGDLLRDDGTAVERAAFAVLPCTGVEVTRWQKLSSPPA